MGFEYSRLYVHLLGIMNIDLHRFLPISFIQEINNNIIFLICQIQLRYGLFSITLSRLLNLSTLCNCLFLFIVDSKVSPNSCYFRTFLWKFGSSSFVNCNSVVFCLFRDFYFQSHFLHFPLMFHFFNFSSMIQFLFFSSFFQLFFDASIKTLEVDHFIFCSVTNFLQFIKFTLTSLSFFETTGGYRRYFILVFFLRHEFFFQFLLQFIRFSQLIQAQHRFFV